MQPIDTLLTVVTPENLTVHTHTDICIRLPIQAIRGSIHIFILYEYESNIILSEATKKRGNSEFVIVFNNLEENTFVITLLSHVPYLSCF